MMKTLTSFLWMSAATTAFAQQPGAAMQDAAHYRFMIGAVRVTVLSDGTVPLNLHDLLRGITPQQTDKLLERSYLTNPVDASINVFLLESGERQILVDTGAGQLFGPGNGGRFQQALQAAGLQAGQVDDILITHIHTDHSGGLVVGGKVMFPNATIHVSKADLDFFLDPSNAAKTGYAKRYFDQAELSLKPYMKAGKVKTFDSGDEVVPGIVAQVQPGHTPGSAFYRLTSRGASVVFIGDTIHAGAVQFPSPRVTITFDQDQDKARKVRLDAFSGFAAQGTLIAAPHLPFPGVGRLRAEGSGYRWFPIEFADRAPEDINSQQQLERSLRSAP